MSFTPIYEEKGFINNSAPAISAENLNDIEAAIKNLEAYMPNVDLKSAVSIVRNTLTGTPIAVLTIDGIGYTIYAPTSGGGGGGGDTIGWNQLVTTGTKIAEVTINGVTVDVYAPSGGGSDIEVIDNLTSDSTTDALSAKQGKVLKQNVDAKEPLHGQQTATLTAGETSVEFSNVPAGSFVVVYTDFYGINPTAIMASGTTVTVTFIAQTVDVGVAIDYR